MADQLREEMAREVVTGRCSTSCAPGAKIEKFNMDGSKPDAAPAKPARRAGRPPRRPRQARQVELTSLRVFLV